MAPEWILSHNELIRDGFAWVGVSAQAAGLAATKTADPIRYADLTHPGDSYSYDVAARQPDTRQLRLWEIAGTAHADDYIANLGHADNGDGTVAVRELNAMLNPPLGTPGFSCAKPINTGQMHYVMNAAQYALNRWATTGIPAAAAPRLDVTTTDAGPSFVLDANGNVTGGIRTPSVDAPVATLSGLGQSGSQFCFLFGTTTPFEAAKLAALYPTHQQFARKWATAAAAGVTAGFIRPADAVDMIAAAHKSSIGA